MEWESAISTHAFSPEDLALHAAFLRRLAARLLSSPDLADDAVQETLVLAWRKQPRVASPRGWLARVLRNVVRNQRRGEERRRARERRRRGQPERLAPEAILAREETRRHLLAAALALPQEEREVVFLRYEAELPPRRIAARLELPPHTVHNRLRRGLRHMRTHLEHAWSRDDRDWRDALGGLLPGLRPSSAAHLGGALMVKKSALLAALLLLALGGTWLLRRGPRAPAARRSAAGPPLVARGPSARGPSLDLAQVPGTPSRTPARAADAIVFGRVLDAATHRPAAGVGVTLFDHERLQVTSTRSDDRGRFAFEGTRGHRGAFRLVLDDPDHAREVLPAVHASRSPLVLWRRDGGWIRGRLQDGSGEAVTHFRVLAVRRLQQPGDAYDQGRVSVRTVLPEALAVDRSLGVDDATGRFRVGPLRPGIHVLVFEVPGHPPLYEGGGAPAYERTKGIAVRAGGESDVGAVTLPDLGEMVVRVIDAQNEEPLDGVTFRTAAEVDGRRYGVRLRPLRREADGSYVLPVHLGADGRPRPACVRLQAPGHGVRALGGADELYGTRWTVRLLRGATLRATIPRPDGRPATGATVLLRRDVDRIVLERTPVDAEGRFTLEDVPAGEDLELVVLDTKRLAVVRIYPLRLRPGETRRATLGGPRQTALEGAVRRRGVPVAGALVSLDTPAGRRVQIQTDAAGRFRYDALEAGPHDLGIDCEDPQVFLQRSVVLAAGRTLSLHVDLDQTLSGTTDWRNPKPGDDGLGNPTLLAQLVDGTGFTVSARIANDGSFALPVPRTAAYTISCAGHHVVGVSHVAAGQDAPPLSLRLVPDPADGHAVFHVVDAATGEVLDDAGFEYRHGGTFGGGSQVDGAVDEPDLPLGRHEYVFDEPRHVSVKVTIEITRERKTVERTVRLPAANAVAVVGFEPTSRARTAGLAPGDVLLTYGAARVRNLPDLTAAVASSSPTDVVTLTILRKGGRQRLDVPGGRMGVRVANRKVAE
jgi:RNA polymerase sigma-70 factor (ECF subfamily)